MKSEPGKGAPEEEMTRTMVTALRNAAIPLLPVELPHKRIFLKPSLSWSLGELEHFET